MPRQPRPPRELVIERLSDGSRVQGEPLVDDFTGEAIPRAPIEPKGELPNTGEIDRARIAKAVNEHALRAWIRQRVVMDEIARGKRPMPRRDFSPQATFERAFRQIKARRGDD